MAAASILTAVVLLAIIAVIGRRYLARSNTSNAPLPPGPKGSLLFGNLKDLPTKETRDWEHWLKHKELYGPISSVSVMGTTMIVINDADLAIELMEKRSNIHSARPTMVFGGEMCGWENALIFQGNTQRLRLYRKQIHSIIGTKTSLQRFVPLQEVEAHRLLFRLIKTPEKLVEHVQMMTGAIILKIGYGYTPETNGRDPLIDQVDEAMMQFARACMPGSWLVDSIPALKYLPDFLDLTGFKKTAKEWNAHLLKTAMTPRDFVLREMSEKCHEPSFLSAIYEKAGDKITPEEEFGAMWSAVSLYTGGADTSVSTILTFFLAMILHPEVQQKAQAEIENYVGTGRLPNLDDRENLPYVNAVVLEALRWHPVAPTGMPHAASTEDVTSNGYRIPKGALLIANIWGFTHDPDRYHDPMKFNPDRFLGKTPESDPRSYVFGFGRRICPGKQLADSSVWLTIAKSLAALDIRKGVDGDGREIEPVVQFGPELISHPAPFNASIKARSVKYEALVLDVERLHPWGKSNAGDLESLGTAPLVAK